MTEIRFIEPGELADYHDAIGHGFGYDPAEDDERAAFEAINPVETSIAAFERGHLVATFGSYDLDLTLPGGATLPMAGTTHVTVHPTHRRRGILTEMMRLHLDQAREREQPLAGLWASEERIYGRFGYGPAAYGQELSIPAYTVTGAAPDPAITVHPLTSTEAAKVLPPLYESHRPQRAGALIRTDRWWEHRVLFDPKSRRGDASAERQVMAERNGQPVGYLRFRLRPLDSWGEGQTRVVELVALDDDVRRALWHFASNVDLYRNIRWWNAPLDEPTLLEADRFRRVERRVMDSLWLRPLDVAPVLEARSYDRDGTAVLDVTDRLGATGGRFRLEVAAGSGSVESTNDEPDVELAVGELARLVLGGTSAVTLGRAGLLAGTTSAAAALDDLLSTRTPPHIPEVF
ncbi:MAG: GNAT family N-acetyltransferase [Actinomycetota bacterium]